MRSLILVLLAGCVGEADLDRLWSPSQAVSGADAVYAPMPHIQAIVRVDASGDDPAYIDLDEQDLRTLFPDATGEGVFAFTEWTEADDRPDDAPGADRERPDRRFEALYHIEGTERRELLKVDAGLGALFPSPDGAFLISRRDEARSGLSSLGAVGIHDLTSGQTWSVEVGFGVTDVRFAPGADGAPGRAVLMADGRVAVVDLSEPSPVPAVSYPLTLDAFSTPRLLNLELTPDASYAVLALDGRNDLYVLDLRRPSINLVPLSGSPTGLTVVPEADVTVVALTGGRVDIIDHDLFEPTTVQLETSVRNLEVRDGAVIAWGDTSSRALYRIDPLTRDVRRYRTTGFLRRVYIEPQGRFGLAFTDSDNASRVELFSLASVDDQPISERVTTLGASSAGRDAAFTEDADGVPTALILLSGDDVLYRLSWPSLAVDEVFLPEPPLAIGALPTGSFWVTHPSPLGQLSFIEGDEVDVRFGFATHELLTDRSDPDDQ